MKIISIMGRPGSGKGTQADILSRKTGFMVINTGQLLREKAEENDFIGGKVRQILAQGKLIPTPVVFSLWMPKLIEVHQSSAKGIIFDGNPRKLYEAYLLEEVFEMFQWKDFCACYLQISGEEAYNRLKKRGREDDSPDEIKERLSWFDTEVMPVIDYYREKGVLMEIDGEKSINEIEEELWKKLFPSNQKKKSS